MVGVLAAWGVALSILAIPVTAQAHPFDGTAAGTIISHGPLPEDLWFDGVADAHQVTYWTVSPAGAPAPSTGAVFVPEGPVPAGGWPVVSWAHGTTGIGDSCAPSRAPRSDVDAAYLSGWLSRGYAVVATDYVGLGTEGVHAYLHGQSEGKSVIDMVRAGRALLPDLSSTWVAVGHSQGGHAAMFAAHAATRYAPELDYRGAVATGTPANLDLVLPLGGPRFPDLGLFGATTFSSFILQGLTSVDPDVHIERYLTDRGVALVEAAAQACFDELEALGGGMEVSALVKEPLGDDAVRAALREYLEVPVSGYDRPIFVAHGLADRTVPYPLGAKLAMDLQAAGQDVTFASYSGGHSASMQQFLPDAATFVAGLMQ